MRSNKDNVDKPLEGKGDLSEAKEIKQIATDLEKLKSDFDDETIQLMKEQFDKDKKPGEGFLDYIKRLYSDGHGSTSESIFHDIDNLDTKRPLSWSIITSPSS